MSTDVALRDGTWQSYRGVQRWVSQAEKATASPALVLLLACPTCHARVGQTCRTKSGHTTTPHGSRLAPRLCECGALLGPRRRFCDPCRDRVNQENKNAWGRRARSARRALTWMG